MKKIENKGSFQQHFEQVFVADKEIFAKQSSATLLHMQKENIALLDDLNTIRNTSPESVLLTLATQKKIKAIQEATELRIVNEKKNEQIAKFVNGAKVLGFVAAAYCLASAYSSTVAYFSNCSASEYEHNNSKSLAWVKTALNSVLGAVAVCGLKFIKSHLSKDKVYDCAKYLGDICDFGDKELNSRFAQVLNNKMHDTAVSTKNAISRDAFFEKAANCVRESIADISVYVRQEGINCKTSFISEINQVLAKFSASNDMLKKYQHIQYKGNAQTVTKTR